MSETRPDPPGVPARRAALRLLDAVLRQGLPLEAALPNAAAALDRLEDRGLAHALAAETLRRLSDLDALIDAATPRPLPHDAKARFVLRLALVQALVLGTPPHAAIATVLPLVDGGPRRLVHGVFGAVIRSGAALPELPALPPPVAKRWRKSYGEAGVLAARAALVAQPPIDITLRDPASLDEWSTRLDGISLAPGHLRLPRGASVPDREGFGEGAWWVQDLAASLPARLLGAGEGRRALDLCAAPGGKTMQLATAGWAVTALDQSETRLARLRENLARTQLDAEIVVGDALEYASPDGFDAVLLDAPCSATGIYRRHPDVLHRVNDRAIRDLAHGQARLLAHAASLVRPGGRLIYAVCSLERQEGEAIAASFAQSGFSTDPVTLAELPAGFAPDADGRLRVAPGTLADAGGADGFFVARFRRSQ